MRSLETELTQGEDFVEAWTEIGLRVLFPQQPAFHVTYGHLIEHRYVFSILSLAVQSSENLDFCYKICPSFSHLACNTGFSKIRLLASLLSPSLKNQLKWTKCHILGLDGFVFSSKVWYIFYFQYFLSPQYSTCSGYRWRGQPPHMDSYEYVE
jgi:hypothetical protein